MLDTSPRNGAGAVRWEEQFLRHRLLLGRGTTRDLVYSRRPSRGLKRCAGAGREKGADMWSTAVVPRGGCVIYLDREAERHCASGLKVTSGLKHVAEK